MNSTMIRKWISNNIFVLIVLMHILLLPQPTNCWANNHAPNYSKALQTLTPLAEQGKADAQYHLGLLYYHGHGIATDRQKAFSLFSAAAKQHHPYAQYSLAIMYVTAQGVDQNLQQALQWFRKSALQEIPQAQFNLGIFHQYGYIVEKDLAMSKKWYALAEHANLIQANLKLTELHNADQLIIQHPNAEDMVNDHALQEQSTTLQSSPIAGNDWIQQQHGHLHTLQLSSFSKKSDTVNFIKRLQLSGIIYVEVVIDDITRYNTLYGSYETYEDAKKVMDTLPENITNNHKPWIRTVADLQKIIKQK